ncbi:MAG: DUF502 domain-containing protein [Bdellovibrionota bacterium]
MEPKQSSFSMKNIGQIFLRGALVLLPLFVSIYVLIWLAGSIDGVFGRILKTLNPELELPSGFGLIIGASIIFIVGITSEFLIAKSINNFIQSLMARIPGIGAIFNALKSLADYLNPKNNAARGKTVVVHFPSKDAPQKFKLVGFMTVSNLKNMPKGINDDELVTVFVPMSYQMGGFSIFVNRSQVEEINLPFEKAMQGALTGWVQI